MRTRQPVTDLQQMLRQLSTVFPQFPAITPDGCFGEHTLEAVMIFQRDSGLPVTGTVDRNTWHAMEARCSAPLPGSPRRPTDDISLALYPWMFNALSRVTGSFVPCEINSPAFRENLCHLQRISGLHITGKPDDDSWNHLFRLFRLFLLRIPPK